MKKITWLLPLMISVITISCSKDTGTDDSIAVSPAPTPPAPPPPPATPAITAFAPVSAALGANVTITGSNFTGATAVLFGGVPAQSFSVQSATSIIAQVPVLSSGNVSVTTPGGTAILAGFTYQQTTIQFTSTGAHSFTVSNGLTKVRVQLMGPGGWGGTGNGIGGNGGNVFGDLEVSAGEQISLYVGQGSSSNISPQFTSIKRGSTMLALAASGGNGSPNGGKGGNAGASGSSGTLGTSAFLSGTAGSGATPSAGGAGGSASNSNNAGSNGTALNGGTNNADLHKAGWGGSGWFGGGASATYSIILTSGSPFASGGGGGGSNYKGGLTGTITNGSSGAPGGNGGGSGASGKITIIY